MSGCLIKKDVAFDWTEHENSEVRGPQKVLISRRKKTQPQIKKACVEALQ